MPAGGANLFFDQMIVIEKPFSGGSDAPAALDGVGDQLVRAGQHRFIVRETREQLIRRTTLADFVQASQGFGVLLKLIDAEQFSPKRRFFGALRIESAI